MVKLGKVFSINSQDGTYVILVIQGVLDSRSIRNVLFVLVSLVFLLKVDNASVASSNEKKDQ